MNLHIKNGLIKAVNPTQLLAVFLILSALAVTFLLYRPGLSGTYILDDKVNLRAINETGGVTDFDSLRAFVFSNKAGSLGRPISMLSFLINDQYFPGDPSFYKFTNLMIHLICGLCLFLLISKILVLAKLPEKSNTAISLFVMIYWLVHPLNVSTTLYIIQRMTQLMTLFTILGLYFYCVGRQQVLEKNKHAIALLTGSFSLFTLLAVLSKENGILICLYVLILESTIFAHLPRDKSITRWLYVFSVTPLALLVIYFSLKWGNLTNGYIYRDFTLWERVMTECRILFSYLIQIIFPQPGGSGLYHDDIVISKSLISPVTTLFSIIIIIASVFLAIKFRKKYSFASFGILWFFGGHLLESSFIPLELYYEHRNYLPMIGPILAISYYFSVFLNRIEKKSIRRVLFVVPVFFLSISTLLTSQASLIWGHPPSLYKLSYLEHPDSLRAASMHAQMLNIQGDHAYALELMKQTFEKHPYAAALPILMLDISCKNDLKEIYKVEDIIEFTRSGRYVGLLPKVILDFYQTNLQKKCLDDDTTVFLDLLSALENMTNVRGTAMASILLLRSDIYVSQRQLSPAVETLDRAFKFKKIPSIPVQQARLLASAGLYDEALKYIEIAKKADANKRAFVPSDLPKIEYLEKIYQKRATEGAAK